MVAGNTQFFGTKDQPNNPAPVTTELVLPSGARCALVEIDLIETLQEE
jgi:hypothetical protein